jgi:lipoprotein-anchoring transpeptidase ErfK/SrfK
VEGSVRQMALVTGPNRSLKQIGPAYEVPDRPLRVQDLPRARGVLVLESSLPKQGEPKVVQVGGQKAVEAAGGEPDFSAWRPDPERGLVPVNYYELAAPVSPPAPTAIVVDTYLNVLWYYEDGQLVQTSRVTTGKHVEGPRPTAANQRENKITPTGTYKIVNKFQGLPHNGQGIPAGDPRNPLGTRWMGFSVFPGDNGMLWAIHGTNQPELLGRWASDGSIRMANPEIERLYDRVKVGTVLEIIRSRGQ